MIRAFALVRRQVAARLLILGDGKGRAAIEARVSEAGLGDDVRLPGFVDNPWHGCGAPPSTCCPPAGRGSRPC